MGIAVIILGLFIVLLVVVIYKQGRIIKAKDAEIEELSQSKVTKKSDKDGMATDIAIKALNHNTVNDSYCKENCKGYQETWRCYADWDCKAKRKAEQNLAWSEEDEELLNGFIKEVESELKRPNLKGDDLILNKKISWLKSLKERFKQAMEE